MRRLLEMQENPEHYSDEEIRQLMADEECRQLYEQMVRGTDAVFAAKDYKNEGMEEGRDESGFNVSTQPSGTLVRARLFPIGKVAAVFIGLLMLTGITYAAFYIMRGEGGNTNPELQESPALSAQQQKIGEQPADSTVTLEPVVFKDKELGTILSEVAAFYKCDIVYKNEKVKHVRLYFTWDKTKSIDEVVETFNKFERFHIIREEKQLIVYC